MFRGPSISMQRVSLNASLCERKPNSNIGIAVSQDEAPFSPAYSIARCWLGGKLSFLVCSLSVLIVDYMKDSCLMLCLHFNQRIFRLQCQDKCYLNCAWLYKTSFPCIDNRHGMPVGNYIYHIPAYIFLN